MPGFVAVWSRTEGFTHLFFQTPLCYLDDFCKDIFGIDVAEIYISDTMWDRWEEASIGSDEILTLQPCRRLQRLVLYSPSCVMPRASYLCSSMQDDEIQPKMLRAFYWDGLQDALPRVPQDWIWLRRVTLKDACEGDPLINTCYIQEEAFILVVLLLTSCYLWNSVGLKPIVGSALYRCPHPARFNYLGNLPNTFARVTSPRSRSHPIHAIFVCCNLACCYQIDDCFAFRSPNVAKKSRIEYSILYTE